MKTAFAIGAHPDDIEFFMAGTLILLRDAGYAIHYMTLANGCCGTTQYDPQTITAMRRTEAAKAAASIGATFHDSICNDLEVFYDLPTLKKLASVMRVVAPDIVLTHPPADYMEDHMNTCRLVVTAAFARGMPNFEVAPARACVDKKVTIYHAQPFWNRDAMRRPVEPDLFVDVSSVEEQKVAMLALHASQKQWLDESQGHDSYLKTLRDLDEEVGRMSGLFRVAEGWRRHLHLGFCGEKDDPLREALPANVLLARENA